jgi:hypothetical protein
MDYTPDMRVFEWGAAFVAVLVLAFYSFRNLWRWKIAENENYRSWDVLPLIGVTVVLFLYMFVAFPAGEPVEVTPATEEGMYQQTMKAPDEKPPEVLKVEAEEKKPDALKRQDEGFEKDQAEADAYLKKAMEGK